MSEPQIIGKPAVLVVDDNREWVENIEFSLGDQYRIVAAPDLASAAGMVERHGPAVLLLDWEIAKREVERARRGLTRGEHPLPVILVTGLERPEVEGIADRIGGCIAIVERLDRLEELEREIAKVTSCAAAGEDRSGQASAQEH